MQSSSNFSMAQFLPFITGSLNSISSKLPVYLADMVTFFGTYHTYAFRNSIFREYEKLDKSIAKIKGFGPLRIVTRAIQVAKTSGFTKDDFGAFLQVYERLLSDSDRTDPASLRRAEIEIYTSICRVEKKATAEHNAFRNLNLNEDAKVSTDNRISERAFSVLKSAEYRLQGASNDHLWTISTSKLSETSTWLKEKDETTRNSLIWGALRSRRDSKVNLDARKRDQILKYLHFNHQEAVCLVDDSTSQ